MLQKKMDSDQKVQQDKVDQIIAAAQLAPSGYGLQPYKIIVVTNQELKEKIRAVGYNQSQITDCSHLLIFAAWDLYTEKRVLEVFRHTNRQRGLPEDKSRDNIDYILGVFEKMTSEEQFNHAARQSYISFGIAITEAALLGVDATPMEGFDPLNVDKLLGLKEQGLRSTTLLPLGYRDENEDWLVNLKKVRTPLTDFVIEFK
ncbi:nitroreductase family protein [Pedobacter lusitanus]|uniref:nitroreductase family protein n=1 Tax=Pedobacter lusitanus TaxID=1503925 RepID=UPI000AC70EB2|nr:nitroreductase family protein [Pedobacter lusitanus]